MGLKDIDWDYFNSILESGTHEEFQEMLTKYDLSVNDGKIIPNDKTEVNKLIEYWDKSQHIRKINLNALYGSLLQSSCRFFDKRLGQSTTLTGRQIVKHMTAETNKIIDGEYNYIGNSVIYNDTDSCDGSTIIRSNAGNLSIEQLFNCGNQFWQEDTQYGTKEYSCHPDIKVASYDNNTDMAYFGNINYIYRHRVSKERWEIIGIDDNSVIVTGDHSIMVERNGNMIESKPRDILDSDILYNFNDSKIIYKTKIKSVRQVENFNDEYVYDIGMKNENHPWFFGNNILIHNSVYFSAYPILQKEIDSGQIEWTRDSVVELYDKIGDMVNETFPDFMERAFHCPKNRGSVIKSGREIVGETALFITKKRYAVLYYDKEGKRADKDGKPGKIKAMGLDLKRADTPEYMQDFLSEILEDVLTDVKHAIIVEKIKKFREEFKNRPGWEKGTPKRVNNIGKFLGKEQDLIDQDKTGKVNIPGHVRAAINWNILKRMYNDNYSMNIVDGFKTIVCKLKDNPFGFTSVAYPIDELRLPEWYKELPFDHDAMEETIIDNKIQNLIGVLNFDISSTIETNTFNNLFDFDE